MEATQITENRVGNDRYYYRTRKTKTGVKTDIIMCRPINPYLRSALIKGLLFTTLPLIALCYILSLCYQHDLTSFATQYKYLTQRVDRPTTFLWGILGAVVGSVLAPFLVKYIDKEIAF